MVVPLLKCTEPPGPGFYHLSAPTELLNEEVPLKCATNFSAASWPNLDNVSLEKDDVWNHSAPQAKISVPITFSFDFSLENRFLVLSFPKKSPVAPANYIKFALKYHLTEP